jgi:hypothetical protein
MKAQLIIKHMPCTDRYFVQISGQIMPKVIDKEAYAKLFTGQPVQL